MNYKIIDIEGIGPKYESILSNIGVQNTYDYYSLGLGRLNYLTKGLLSQNLIKSWFHMIELTLIPNLNPQYAEALYKNGISSISILKNRSLENVKGKLEDAFNKSLIPDIPKDSEIINWLIFANVFCSTATIKGRIMNANRKAIKDANIIVGDTVVSSNSNGYFVVTEVKPWSCSFRVQKAGYFEFEKELNLDQSEISLNVFLNVSTNGQLSPWYQDESRGEVVTFKKGDISVSNNLEISDLNEGDLLAIYHHGRYEDGLARLCKLDKVREGNRVIYNRVKVPQELLDEIVPNVVYTFQAGKFTASSLTIQEYWADKIKAKFSLDVNQLNWKKK